MLQLCATGMHACRLWPFDLVNCPHPTLHIPSHASPSPPPKQGVWERRCACIAGLLCCREQVWHQAENKRPPIHRLATGALQRRCRAAAAPPPPIHPRAPASPCFLVIAHRLSAPSLAGRSMAELTAGLVAHVDLVGRGARGAGWGCRLGGRVRLMHPAPTLNLSQCLQAHSARTNSPASPPPPSSPALPRTSPTWRPPCC